MRVNFTHKNEPVRVSVNGGMSFSGLLTIIFITLKLIGKISWSWWWVLSPLWIPWVIILGILLLVFIGFLVFGK